MVLSMAVSKSEKTIIGISQVTRRMTDFAGKVAKTDHTVLLRGETGVGKDCLAEFIHAQGGLQRPFVPVDCGALTESLSENELFGHTRGAYTDAREIKPGLIEIAAGGTLFFNEVANMSPALQAKFLRILDKGTYRPVGGITERPISARFIAATNADLEDAVRRGQFRSDLYHRLKQIPYLVPPLRERTDDIPALVEFFLQQEGSATRRFSLSAMEAMREHCWPGNVRELKHMVIRIAFLTDPDRDIQAEDVQPHLSQVDDLGFPTLEDHEREYICEVLRRSEGNLKKAASMAGVTRPTLVTRVRKYRLQEFVHLMREKKLKQRALEEN